MQSSSGIPCSIPWSQSCPICFPSLGCQVTGVYRAIPLWHTGILPPFPVPQQAPTCSSDSSHRKGPEPKQHSAGTFSIFSIFVCPVPSAWEGGSSGDPRAKLCQPQEQEHPLPTAQPGVPHTATASGVTWTELAFPKHLLSPCYNDRARLLTCFPSSEPFRKSSTEAPLLLTLGES